MAHTLEDLHRAVIRFRDERDWEQFHKPKDLAVGLTVEAAELAELFLWKSEGEVGELLEDERGRERLSEELADTFIFLLYLGHSAGIDLGQAVEDKLRKNALKYPVEKARGKALKYSEL